MKEIQQRGFAMDTDEIQTRIDAKRQTESPHRLPRLDRRAEEVFSTVHALPPLPPGLVGVGDRVGPATTAPGAFRTHLPMLGGRVITRRLGGRVVRPS